MPEEAEAEGQDKKQAADKLGRIVRTKTISMKPMSPEEATLQMELLGHDFFVFRNAETDQLNVVYRRRDGDYGLIEPESAATAITGLSSPSDKLRRRRGGGVSMGGIKLDCLTGAIVVARTSVALALVLAAGASAFSEALITYDFEDGPAGWASFDPACGLQATYASIRLGPGHCRLFTSRA